MREMIIGDESLADIGISPEPLSGWSMYDHDLVVSETLDGSVQLTDPTVVARYSSWLEELLAIALAGMDAAQFCQRVAASLTDD